MQGRIETDREGERERERGREREREGEGERERGREGERFPSDSCVLRIVLVYISTSKKKDCTNDFIQICVLLCGYLRGF